MMYSNKFVVALKVEGKVLREAQDVVRLPFGCEYSILLKNLNSVNSVVSIEIDGKSVTPQRLVVPAGQEVELERSVSDQAGRKFKFIERSAEIEAHRGVRLEDSLLRVSFQFERQNYVSPVYSVHDQYCTRNMTAINTGSTLNNVLRYGNPSVSNCSLSSVSLDSAQNDVGITVQGSASSQSFRKTYVNQLDPVEHVLVFRLSGYRPTPDCSEVVAQPLTIQSRKHCPSCGKTYKSSKEYCAKDGTFLI